MSQLDDAIATGARELADASAHLRARLDQWASALRDDFETNGVPWTRDTVRGALIIALAVHEAPAMVDALVVVLAGAAQDQHRRT